jgi:hypothetical protein
MPNKFSHSVVLAHYSSLGLIDLPNSQHVAYLNTYPPSSSGRPSTASTAQSNHSKASHGGDANENTSQNSAPGQTSHSSRLTNAVDSRRTTGRRVILDADVSSKTQHSTALSKGQEKMSSTSTSQINSRSNQKNSKQFAIQPTSTSRSDCRELVTEKRTSRAIRTETYASSHPSTVPELSHNASQPASSGAGAAINASDRVRVL